MNSELKAKIKMADAKLACSKNILDTVSTSLNREIEKFGIYRQTILENTVGRFKRDMKIIGKQVKDNAYSIPYELEIAKLADVTLNEVEFSSEQIFRITTNVSKVTIACTNKVFEMIGKRKRINIDGYNSPNRNSGNGWFDIVIAAVELLGTIAEKKMQEEAEVKRYVAETDVLCKKVDMQTEFCRQILKRIEEIILVSDELEARCVDALKKMETILHVFDATNQIHLGYFQSAMILIKGISELSKVEILDSKGQISQLDQQYIIKSRQLLTATL